MSSRLLEGLNPEQLEAVTLPRVSALVLAGAGSGKTRVLTTRIAHLIATGQARPGEILAVTFTNKAAREMATRIGAMIPVDLRGMWIGTFHGLANRLLRIHHREAGLPRSFQILDSQDQLAVVKRLLKSLNVDENHYPPRQLAWFINAHKEKGLRAAKVEAADASSHRMAELYAAYDEQCQREGAVDFAELLLRSYELLAGNDALREHYRERFRFILVDEFQDTNRLQYQWVRLIAGAQGAVFAVGDDDQSIYAFRGAEAGNMRDFEREFRVEKVIRLEQNYRSHGNILDAANALIKNNVSRLGKNLWTREGKGEPIRVFEAPTDGDEARFIVDEVRALREEGVALSEIALLYRSNAQSRILEHSLVRDGLPYRVYGGVRFFERQEVKHAMAYLRLALRPDDDGAFLRVVNFPPRGVGLRTVELVQEAANTGGTSLAAAARAGGIGGRTGSALAQFVALIDRLAEAAKRLPLPQLIEEILALSGLRAHYQGERDGADRLENLDELVTAATLFEPDPVEGEDQLSQFLTHASLEAGEHEAAQGQDALQLMTVHSAKGLEFHAVFVSGLEEGLFPHESSFTEHAGLEEERRLMYVAITRARRRLYLSYAQSRMLHGQTRYGLVSRFVEEIPAALCRWIRPPRREVAYAGYTPGEGKARAWAGERVAARPAAVSAGFAGYPFAIGQNVRHARFGEGVVLSIQGRGADALVEVKFRKEGVKRLMLEYAKLTAA